MFSQTRDLKVMPRIIISRVMNGEGKKGKSHFHRKMVDSKRLNKASKMY
jgi:hypothetical protein